MAYPLTYKQYYEGLKAGKLLGLKCRKCGAVTAPPKINCLQCNGADLEVVELSGQAEIKTFTVVRVPPEGMTAPYVVALAELAEGPWVMGNLEVADPGAVTMDIIGKKVTIGHKVVPADLYSAGEGVAVTFSICESPPPCGREAVKKMIC